jgi:hypothetical protein
MRPVPFEALLLIYGFAVGAGCLRVYAMNRKEPPFSRKAKLQIVSVLLGLFLLLAALNAVANSRSGLPQF